MRKLTALLLMLLALPALAEPAENLALDAPFGADLNGDGVQETVTWRYAEDGDGENRLCLEVNDALYRTAVTDGEAMWLKDFDGPALVVTGRDADGVALTQVLQYTLGGRLRELMFNADGRDLIPDEYYSPTGYGLLHSMSGDTVTLECAVDVLGTWPALRTYRLSEQDRFVFDGNVWRASLDPGDPAAWEGPVLTCARVVEYTDEQGETQALQTGARLRITVTDRETVARFVTEDGETGTLSIRPGYESDDFLFAVNGISERKLFTFVPYAG